MKKIKISVDLGEDGVKFEELAVAEFEIPETERINISEIERLFLGSEKILIRKAIAECLENLSKKKPNLSPLQLEVISLKITKTIESILK